MKNSTYTILSIHSKGYEFLVNSMDCGTQSAALSAPLNVYEEIKSVIHSITLTLTLGSFCLLPYGGKCDAVFIVKN